MESLKLDWRKGLDSSFLSHTPIDFYQSFPNPTLFEIEGESDECLFISTLLHGNETTGFYSLQKFLKQFEGKKPNRNLLILIGNPQAARADVRHLPKQKDFNRVWRDESLELVKSLLQGLAQRKVFACVDIHNTTGKNPPYSVIHNLSEEYLALAKVFSENIIYFVQPREALSVRLSDDYLAMTIECGLSSRKDSIDEVLEFLNALHDKELDDLKIQERPKVYNSYGRLFVPKDAEFAFDSLSHVDFSFIPDIEDLNFKSVKAGHVFGHYFSEKRLILLDREDKNISDEYIDYKNGEISFKKDVRPSLLTSNSSSVRQDVLGYLMEPVKY